MDEPSSALPRFAAIRKRLRPAGDFAGAESGLAATELALILPAAMLLLSLATAGGQGFEIQRRVSLTASTIAGLVAGTPYSPDPSVSGATQISSSDLDTDIALAAEVMYPLNAANMKVVVSELRVNTANNTGVVVWSRAGAGATALATSSVITLDPSLVSSGATYLILGQVQYTYQPISFAPSIASLTMNATQILVPRSASQITIN
jgi:hypothetical protein